MTPYLENGFMKTLSPFDVFDKDNIDEYLNNLNDWD